MGFAWGFVFGAVFGACLAALIVGIVAGGKIQDILAETHNPKYSEKRIAQSK